MVEGEGQRATEESEKAERLKTEKAQRKHARGRSLGIEHPDDHISLAAAF